MTASPDPEVALRWWADGELAVAGHIDRLTDDDLAADSNLPDWSRAHVVAHLARNADALINLLTWARTGVETPMYPSREVRNAGIAATAAAPPAELRSDYVGRLRPARADAIEAMPAEAWTAEIRTNQGDADPGVRGAVDAGQGGVGARHRPPTPASPSPTSRRFCAALVDDVLGLFAARDQTPDVTVVATDVDRTWGSGGTRVEGPVAAVAAWLTRGDASGLSGDVPPPPAWL